MATDPARLRSLKIKTGVVKRYTKEKISYEKEAEAQQGKIEKFKQEGKEDLFIKQQMNCLQESVMMVPEVQRKLATAYEELKELAESMKANFEETEEYKASQQALTDAVDHLIVDTVISNAAK